MALNSTLTQAAHHVIEQGLYDPASEHDGCGVGFVAQIEGKRSHEIVQKALESVGALAHRGAMDADAKTGDGTGVLTQIPYEIFRPEVLHLGHHLFEDTDLGVGVFFLPREDAYIQGHLRKITREVLAEQGLCFFGWREVPVRMDILGDKALQTCPKIEHVLVGKPQDVLMSADEYERRLFLVRKQVEAQAQKEGIEDFYLVSFSSRTLVYKGLLTSPQLVRFYDDLRNPAYTTALAVFHQRYSTNTFPTWPLAQPFRAVAHNGEINTIRGNRQWMKAREAEMEHDFWEKDKEYLFPILQAGGSDSASFDNALELLMRSGRDLLQSMMMLVPSPWQKEKGLPENVKDFYQYHSCLNEPWGGPAALVFSDGQLVGACLDRNGFRPARYSLTKEGLLILASEAGVVELEPESIVEKGRLAPGEMIALDVVHGKLLRNNEIKRMVAQRQPYGQWIAKHRRQLTTAFSLDSKAPESAHLLQQQWHAGLNAEELTFILQPMAEKGEEPIGSMGDDAALAIFSKKPRLLYHYFAQHFAQVTNPPIDSIREQVVMSLDMDLGPQRNWLQETPEHANLLHLPSPVLSTQQLEEIRQLAEPHLRACTLSCLFKVAKGDGAGLATAVERLCLDAEKAVDEGNSLLILSDRGIDQEHTSLPMLLAIGAVHHHLIRVKKRMKCSLLCEAADCRDVTHFALLLGYGASAINPYLALETLQHGCHEGKWKEGMDGNTLALNYQKALHKGLLKIMAKMGIATLASYSGGQIFEAIGLHSDIIDRCFTGTPSPLEGMSWPELAEECLQRHQIAFPEKGPPPPLEDAGWYRYRREGEMHAIRPPVLQALHSFVGLKKPEDQGVPSFYRDYVQALHDAGPLAIHHLFKIRKADRPISLEEVEPIESIRRRFTTAAMSLGALSPEAHETLAIAMNRIGGKSNSGEGGESPERFLPLPNGDDKNSRIKQVASGRFGVTAEYLASASEIEIKMAQGAKPGEGGQVLGQKVVGIIAHLRRATPGTSLVSPPPHHDIYSIEDLAQLIHDLKQVNPRAKVCVKLVSEAGVGAIAAGVAKAHADIILISGHDGGTGASPISSIKSAGAPWELGLAEAQQVLLLNGLRNRVTLRADGGMRTGEDIMIASLLGAEEYNFGTTALLALGCVYVRKCHLNTCPVGITTQDEKFRKKFRGTPEGVIAFFNAVAEETRHILARIGVCQLNDIIGRTELLEPIKNHTHTKAKGLNLSRLLAVPPLLPDVKRYHTWERNDKREDRSLDEVILQEAQGALRTQTPVHLTYTVKNIHRSIGARLSGEIAYHFGDQGLPEGTVDISLYGSTGQSLGAFLIQGVRLRLFGEANDYVGKSMSGGEIILNPPAGILFHPSTNFICGNTVLYGATGGAFFARGRAGERFAVRNSGATAVVQGVGDHACEYMTNGVVVVIGPCGKNFGAGMSGGVAYVLDESHQFESLYNPDMIEIERLHYQEDITQVHDLITKHFERTQSRQSEQFLLHWEQYQPLFWKISPQKKNGVA